MLKAMYEDGKDRITKLNAREQKLKKQFEEHQKDHKDRVDKIESKHKEHHLSDEFYKNETRDEGRMFSYWERVRERQHRQYHTSLKIQHSMMSRVKQMIDMYEKTINGKASDKDKVKKELQQVTGGMPEVVLLQQTRKEVVEFCEGALMEAKQARKEVENSPDEPAPRMY
jgi:hypothetical protein